MIAFIDDHRQAYGVEPICKVLPIAAEYGMQDQHVLGRQVRNFRHRCLTRLSGWRRYGSTKHSGGSRGIAELTPYTTASAIVGEFANELRHK